MSIACYAEPSSFLREGLRRTGTEAASTGGDGACAAEATSSYVVRGGWRLHLVTHHGSMRERLAETTSMCNPVSWTARGFCATVGCPVDGRATDRGTTLQLEE